MSAAQKIAEERRLGSGNFLTILTLVLLALAGAAQQFVPLAY